MSVGYVVSLFTKVLYRSMPTWVRRRIGPPLNARHGHGEGWAERHQSSVAEDSFRAQVSQIHRESARAVTIEFELLEGYRFSYRSGQYVGLSLAIGGSMFQRCYSLSSAPDENRYTVTVQKVFHGRVSTFLADSLKVGDEIFVSDPAGDFVLPQDHAEDQRYVMVAGGSGIAPIYSLIKDLLGKNPAIEIQLIYFSRNPDQCIFRRELERLEKLHDGLRIQFHFTRMHGGSHDPAQRLSGEGIMALVSAPASTLFYVCGPNSLVKSCMEGLHQAGIPETRVCIELFNRPPMSLAQTELKPRLVTFMATSILGKTHHIRQRKIETILESARHAGIRIPQKCSVGNCGTCKVRIRSGSVIMDEPNSLTVEEAKDGYVLSCVAHPCENVVVQIP